MNRLNCFLITLVTVTSSTVWAQDDTFVDTSAFGVSEKEINQSCNITVRNPRYRIRSGANKAFRNCGGTLQSSGYRSVIAYGNIGDWIKIGHPNCPNRTAYVFRKAFHESELQALKSGQCAAMLSYGDRNAPAPPKPDYGTTTASGPKNPSGHRFILDRCRGIRSDRHGAGHYHAPRKHGRHHGIDYKAPVGTPLKSPCVGKVIRSGYVGKAGNLLEIRCDNGDRFKMMHLQNSKPRMLRSGSRVGIGTVFGKVGRTGNANARGLIPHIHIEYRKAGGRRRNPAELWNCK